MIKLTLGDTWTRVESDEPHIWDYLADLLKAHPDSYRYTRAFKRGFWDGYVSLFNREQGQFPSGLIDKVLERLQEEEYPDIEVVDTRPSVSVDTVTPDYLDGITLRPYQVEAANLLLEASRGVLKAATNAGKTEVIAAVVKAVGGPAVVIVHKKELLYQLEERLKLRLPQLSNDIGVFGDGKKDQRLITVAMIQSLANNRGGLAQQFSDNQLIFLDECHHLSAEQTFDCVLELPGTFRFGCSGTPLKHTRLADMKLVGATGEILFDITNRELIEKGVSAVPTIFMVKTEAHVPAHANWSSAYRQGVTENHDRNYAIGTILRDCLEKGLPTLCLVNLIEHGKMVHRLVNDSRTIFVSGEDETERRQDALARLRANEVVGVIATDIFGEGVDVPGVGAVILAAGGKSHIQLLQRIGRGLRAKKGVPNVISVFDFTDDSGKDESKLLSKHSKERQLIYAGEGFKVKRVTLREVIDDPVVSSL